jgi:hypothetical protein
VAIKEERGEKWCFGERWGRRGGREGRRVRAGVSVLRGRVRRSGVGEGEVRT